MSERPVDSDDHREPVIVATYVDIGEAEIAQAKLRAFGIESAVLNQAEGGTIPTVELPLGIAIEVLRVVFLVVAGAAAAVCVVDWAVRTRRISPFSGVARFFRRSVDPLLAPIERGVVRRGGLPTTAPWWALGVVVLSGILVLIGLGFVRNQLAVLAAATAMSGGRGRDSDEDRIGDRTPASDPDEVSSTRRRSPPGRGG